MKIIIFYSYLLTCLVYVNVGFSLPDAHNVTDSSPPSSDHQVAGDEGLNIEKNEGTKLNPSLGPEAVDGIESRASSPKPRKNIPNAWEPRQIFSHIKSRGLLRPSLGRHERDYDMSPRSLFRSRRYGYSGRYPGRFSRYAPYGRRYERDPYMMADYEPYPQQYQAQNFPNYQQPQEFSPQSQFPFSNPQQSYLRPQAPLMPAQSYRDPYTRIQSQQPQQFATAPQYFPDDQRVNVRPQPIPSSPSPYYTNRPGPQRESREQPARSEFQRADPFTQFGAPNQPPNQRVGAGSRGNRYPELPFNQFGTSSLQPPAGQRDGARPATIQGNHDRPIIESEVQRTPGSFDQFRTTAQAADQRDGNSSPRRRENRENGDQPIRSEEFERTSGSNDHLRSSTPLTEQHNGAQPAVETAFGAPEPLNGEQPDVQRPLSGLFSYFRGPSAATGESNSSQTSPAIGLGPQQAREQPKEAQLQPQAATVAA